MGIEWNNSNILVGNYSVRRFQCQQNKVFQPVVSLVMGSAKSGFLTSLGIIAQRNKNMIFLVVKIL